MLMSSQAHHPLPREATVSSRPTSRTSRSSMWLPRATLLAGLTSVLLLVDHGFSSTPPAASNGSSIAGGADEAPVDEILKETFVLLEELDERLAQVKKKSDQALAKDNAARALDTPETLNSSRTTEEASIEEALTKLADNFSSDRHSIAPTNNNNNNYYNDDLLQQATSSSSSRKTARQLNLDDHSHQQPIASDSTERHIKFTLDLMHSIFSSQGYSSKTNLIDSFLISPLSIQMVLMMMHLGARGETRREISDCLHLLAAPHSSSSSLIESLDSPDLSSSSSPQANKLKRRHQQQQQQQQQSAPRQSHSSSSQHSTASAATSGANQDPHKLFSGAMRNLLKDPIIMKALTNANQIFLQKNLPLSAQYERSIRHFYGVDVKLVDFQHQSYAGLPDAAKLLDATPEQSQLTEAGPQGGANFSAQAAPKTAPNNIQLMVNEWIERQTKGRISNFLTSPVSTSTLMMAINVLYFRADWQYKFDPSDTEAQAWFTRVDGKTTRMPMMVNRLPLAFAHDPNLKASVIELPYKAQRLGLFLLLPDEVAGIFHTMQMLNSSSFAHMIASMRKPQPNPELGAANGINVRIPKFTIESSPHLSRILGQELGLRSLFSSDLADLSGMFAAPPSHQQLLNNKRTPNTNSSSSSSSSSSSFGNSQPPPLPPQVGLDELLHKAVLEVDEQGSVAAASSASIIERVGLFNSNYFEADHPFLLFLMDKQTGLVLFSGVFAGNNNNNH